MIKLINNDLIISFDFMTKDQSCGLFSMVSPHDGVDDKNDKHIVIKDGHLATSFYDTRNQTVDSSASNFYDERDLTVHDQEG